MSAEFGRRRLLVSAGLAASQHTLAADPEPGLGGIEWLVGAGDTDVLDAVARQMSDVQHTVTRGNVKRIWKALAAGEQICTADVFLKPEYASKIYFSPTVLSPPPVLMTWPHITALLPRTVQGNVLLPALLAHTDLQGVAVAGRNYGDAVNAMIGQRPRKNALTLLESSQSVGHAGEMLLTRRVDYLIGYVRDLDEADGAIPRARSGVQPALLPIDGATALAPAGVACPRTPWGLAAMRRIDAALSAPEVLVLLHRIQDKYLSDVERQRHATELQAFFRARAQPMAGLETAR